MYELSKQEKSFLITIAKRTRINYLEKNHYIYLEDDIDIFNENIFVSQIDVEKNYEKKCETNICVNELEKIFSDPRLVKSVEVLAYKEKLVLFLYYLKEKNDKNIGKKLNLKQDTVTKIRERALKRIKVKYLKLGGENKNV